MMDLRTSLDDEPAAVDQVADAKAPPSVLRRFYVSHFLSTWNSRAFEFGAVLFISMLFPDTLLPASVYALTRSASVIVLSSLLGNVVDRGNRLLVVRASIVGQRLAVVLSCIFLYLMGLATVSQNRMLLWLFLGLLSCLACVEKLSAVANTIAVERDWVVVIAGADQALLRTMNAQMRRIDLFCKLIGPLVVALIAGISLRAAEVTVLGMTCLSLPVEYLAIIQASRVYKRDVNLQRSSRERTSAIEPTNRETGTSIVGRLRNQMISWLGDIVFYTGHRVFLPSLCLALLYLTVFAFGGQMVSFLISTGFTSTEIGILRTVSTVLELSATWAAPLVMERIGAVRSGMWFLNWQIVCICIATGALWIDLSSSVMASGLLVGMIASRVGLWGYDLSAQAIIQEEVEEDQRGRFAAIEASLQQTFELVSLAATIVFSRPSEFRYPAALSAASVVVGGILHAVFVRQRRGHLIHGSKCMKLRRDHRHAWIELAQEDNGP